MGRSEEAGWGWGEHQEVLEEEQGCTGPPSSFPVYSLSVAESESPIQTFFQITDQSITHIHAITNSVSLQVTTHREDKQSF